MRYLLWGAERIGDLVMAIPALKLIRRIRPAAEIAFATTDYAREVAEVCGMVDEILVHRFKGGIRNWRAFARLRNRIMSGEFERVILLGKVTRFRQRVLRDHGSVAAPAEGAGLHTAERHLATVRAALDAPDVETAGLYPDIAFQDDPQRITHLRKRGVRLEEGACLVVHAATNRTLRKRRRRAGRVAEKLWPPERQRVLLRDVRREWPRRQICLVGAKGERDFIERRVLSGLPQEQGLVNLVGETTVRDVLTLLKHAGLLVCSDSGVMHLATLVNCPLVALFGPTDEGVTGPFTDSGQVWRVREAGASRHMADLRVATVLSAVRTALGTDRAEPAPAGG